MSIPVCAICGEVLNAEDSERGACQLCLLRTAPKERIPATHGLPGLIDSA